MADPRPASSLAHFRPGDPDNPRNWPSWRKWSIVLILIPIDFNVSWGASGFSPAMTKFMEDMHVSEEVATLGLSLYVLGLALGPLSQAPLSEYFGRSPLYIGSFFAYALFHMATALAPNLAGFLVLRFLAGLSSAVTISNFGGTIADLWSHHDTGLPMSLFLWAATGGSSTGYMLLSFVAQWRPWRDVFWAEMGITGGLWILMCVVLRETRHPAILRKRVRKALKKGKSSGGGDGVEVSEKQLESHGRPAQEQDTVRSDNLTDAASATSNVDSQQGDSKDMDRLFAHQSWRQLFTVTLARPFRFLCTEWIVIAAALYNGYLYGISFLFNGAFALVFGPKGHGFATYQVGLAFLGISNGITIGVLTNAMFQERHYRKTVKDASTNVPEARVQLSRWAAMAQPVSLFWFAWTTYKSVHWIVPILASALWGWSFYTLILMSYLYTEDSYGMYSASALAGIGLIRNLAGAGFPLFGGPMFRNEGYQWAGSILAFLSLVMVPIPFILIRFGPLLRERSPWAREHMYHIQSQ